MQDITYPDSHINEVNKYIFGKQKYFEAQVPQKVA